MLATTLSVATVEVKLLRPPPLEVPLLVGASTEPSNPCIDLTDSAGALIATAREVPALVAPLPTPPSLAEAVRAADRYLTGSKRAYSGCFVCGPDLPNNESMQIFAGARSADPAEFAGVATPWTPQEWCATEGIVAPEFVWAALDCPGYFAIRRDGAQMLLATLTVNILRRPQVGVTCIVSGWHLSSKGRKHEAGTALHAIDGGLLARAQALWIEPKFHS